MKITATELATITKGKLHGVPSLVISDLLTDSRQFSYSEGLAFFAIKGVNHDGHKFIPQLYERGIRIFVVEKMPEKIRSYRESSFIEVKDTIKAIQQLASYRRKQFKGTVIAITGSAGKTVVKEWLADIMGSVRSVVRSPKSYNSQLGVPLSVWKLGDDYDTGIFEAGISRKGEMKNLLSVIDPDIGVITNIGDAHSENFKDARSKTAEKLVLFRHCSAIVYCRDYEIISETISNDPKLSSKKIADWSFHNRKAEYLVTRTESSDRKTLIGIRHGKDECSFVIPFTDRASVENAVTVAVTCIYSGIGEDIIRTGLANLLPVAMRMEIKAGINGCMLIEDYYLSLIHI